MVRVMRLKDAAHADRSEVGGKALALGRLLGAGLSVPDGFVVTTSAVRRLDETDARAIAAALEQLGDVVVAVRSSAPQEDGAELSYAGQYETVLGVRGLPSVLDAIRSCRASTAGARVASYGGGTAEQGLAVLVQRQVAADVSGVAFSADPITGEAGSVTISAVRGLGERLVSGGANADEWVVRGQQVICVRDAEGALDESRSRSVATLARRVEELSGCPQDIEWAFEGHTLALLQARPITALPEVVSWQAPPGAWARNFRLGEWLGEPVSPLFETWLLQRLESGFADIFRQNFGFPARPPHHAIVNGWYYASLDFLPKSPGEMLAMLGRHFLPKFVQRPRWTSLALPPLAGLGVELHVADWQDRILPDYRRAVARAEAVIDVLPLTELLSLVDELGHAAGAYFASITFVAGFAWKAELALAEWLKRCGVGENHTTLLLGFGTTTPPPHAVTSLDFAEPTLGEARTPSASLANDVAALRAAAEVRVRTALGTRARQRKFERLLARAQRFARLREQQVADFTLPWPVLRRAVARCAAELVEKGRLSDAGDIYYLRYSELTGALAGAGGDLRPLAQERRQRRQRERRLAAPLVLGDVPPMLEGLWARAGRLQQAPASEPGPQDLCGLAASPGQASGIVRVVRGFEDFHRLEPGEVLVAPATTPAWTPLFARAVALVTDAGSVLAHASIVAREFGIPAVIATTDATARLRDGQYVTVDGNRGIVRVDEAYLSRDRGRPARSRSDSGR